MLSAAGGEEGADEGRVAIGMLLGKFAFGDRTIPIHARTLGFDVSPHEMDVYYGTVQSAVVHTNLTPLSIILKVRTHTSNPAFPTGGGLGGFVFLPVGVAVLLGKFAFGDRTIPIHARALGFDVSPHVATRWTCTTVQYICSGAH
jgi:hypothetical protein